MIEHNQFAPLAPNRLQQIDVAFAANRIMGGSLRQLQPAQMVKYSRIAQPVLAACC